MSTLLAALVLLSLGVQVYHYALYPGLLWLLSRLRPRPVAVGPVPVPVTVTVVTAAHDEAPIIAEKIRNLLALDWPDLQIIVVCDGCADGTEAIARGFADRGVETLALARRGGKPGALNLGFRHARGDVVVVSDANTLCPPDAIRMLLRNFHDPAVGLVSGDVATRRDESGPNASTVAAPEGIYWRYEAAIRRWESALGSTVSVVGALLAVRRPLYPGIPPDTVNDDVFLSLHVQRRGMRVVYEPAARCVRRSSRRMADDARRRRRMAAGRWQLLLDPGNWPWRDPLTCFFLASHKALRLVLPAAMALALLANAAMFPVGPVPVFFQLTLVGQLCLYGLAGLGRVAEKRRRRWRLPLLAWYVVRGHLGVAEGLLQHLGGRRTVLWQKVNRV